MSGLIFLILGTLLTFGSANCSPNALNFDHTVQSAAKTITATEKENGGRLELHPDDVLAVKLESIPGTGYSWQISRNDPAVMKPLGKPDYQRTGKKAIGAVEYGIFRFKALARGTSVLEMHYRRVWEKGKEPLKTYRLTVQIN